MSSCVLSTNNDEKRKRESLQRVCSEQLDNGSVCFIIISHVLPTSQKLLRVKRGDNEYIGNDNDLGNSNDLDKL